MQKNQYECKSIPYNTLKERIELPKFQRSIVWKKSAKEKFIETLRLGFPFGSLLLYKIYNEEKYLLIDGLQRFSTIQSFESNPCDYLDLIVISEREIKDLLNIIENYKGYEIPETEKNFIQKTFINICKEYNISTNANDGIILKKIIEKLSLNSLDNDTTITLMGIMNKIRERIKSEINLDTLYVPVIIFSGEYSDLPSIYESINASGTKLSKYEIYAAVWNNKKYKIYDSEILEKVEEKYDNMFEKSNILITGYHKGDIIQSQEINLFEYACALGKIIKDKCPDIFWDSKENGSDIDSIGFILLSMCINRNSKIDKNLSAFFDRASSRTMINLKNKIVECCEQVNKLLKPYVRLNNKSEPQIKHFPYQITLIIATLFHIKFEVNFDLSVCEKQNSKKQKEQFQKNMPLRYLYDYIKDCWGKRSDTQTANNRLLSANSIYITEISKENWRSSLEDFMLEQLNSESYQRKKTNNLFLTYIIKLSMHDNDVNYNNFDIEYAISMTRLKESLKSGPFSDVGNFYFKEKRNRKTFELGYLSPEQNEVNFIKNPKTFTIENYRLFLKNRHNYLINKFLECI